MKSRFLAQHFTVNISKFQLPRKGVKSQLSISFSMSMFISRVVQGALEKRLRQPGGVVDQAEPLSRTGQGDQDPS